MTLSEVQQDLKESIRKDCESKLRDVVASRNALAAIHYLMHGAKETIGIYQNTLEFCIEQNANYSVQTDHLQLIHICRNLLLCDEECSTLSSVKRNEIESIQIEHTNAFLELARQALQRVWRREEQLFNANQRIPYFYSTLIRCCQHIDANVVLEGYWDETALPMRGGVNTNNSLIGKPIEEIVDSCKKLQDGTYGRESDYPYKEWKKYESLKRNIEVGREKE